MQALLNLLQNVGIFLAFLAARLAVLLLVLAALTVVFLAGLAVVRLVARAKRQALGLTRVGGLSWRPAVFYTPGHAWLQANGGNRLRVGLDDLAQHVLVKITRLELPSPGQTVRAGEPAVVVHAGRRQALVPAAVSGRVVSINRRLLRNPARLHNDPYSGGWLYTVQPEDDSHARLPSGERSRAWFSGEAVRFSHFLEHQLGLAAADGGELVAPGPSLLSDEQWKEMTGTFLNAC